MENAVEALKMAAAVLIFIIAITTTFSIISTAKNTADSIITMRDKQAYLESADLDGGILYTSSSNIKGETDVASIGGVTTKGDRIVSVEDVVSTILRYHKEKYGVTIMKSDGTIIARYDSNTDQVMTMWDDIKNEETKKYIGELKKNTKTSYIGNNEPNFDEIEELYKIAIEGEGTRTFGAPWYGNEEQIQIKIARDLDGSIYTYNRQTYTGKNLLNTLNNAGKIVEVTNEIDNSAYLEDTDKQGEDKTTDLLQQYEMPTIEIVYIILN